MKQLDKEKIVIPHCVCVYCGSSNHVDPKYKQIAKDVGKSLAENGVHTVYGGGHVGLMGVLADSCLAAGGKITGIIPNHICAYEVQHTGLTELLVVESMHARKSLMAQKADAFVILPGGFGTLDETFEILTWRQLGLHEKPIVFFDKDGFWEPLFHLIDHLVDTRFTAADNKTFYQTVTTTDDMLKALAAPPAQCKNVDNKWK